MRTSAFAAGGLALTLALAGCGNSTTGEASPVHDDAQKLAAAAKNETTESTTSKFTLEMDMMGQQVTANGQGRYAESDTAMSMSMEAAGQQMQMRLVDQTMYLKMPQGVPGAEDKPWLKVSPDGSGPLAQMLGNMDQFIDQSDPSKTLEQIEQAGSITNSERTQLDGEPVTHYWIELELAKLSEQLPAGMSQETLEKMQQEGGIDALPMQLWLNEDELPVRYTSDMSEMVQAAAEATDQQVPGGQATMTMRYTDWGTEVNVQAPPEEKVGELPKMPAPGNAPGSSGSPGMPEAPGSSPPTS